jgi:chromosome segregation ATPase
MADNDRISNANDSEIERLGKELKEKNQDIRLAETKLAEERRMALLCRSQLDDVRSQFDSLKFLSRNELTIMQSQIGDLRSLASSQVTELTELRSLVGDIRAHIGDLKQESVESLAREVWRERRRRKPTQKIRRWFALNWPHLSR